MKHFPHPTDKHVGALLRTRRMMLGLTQEKVAAYLGLTFQQVQKYEKGTNRISASKLDQIATFLSVPVSYFFNGLGKKGPSEQDALREILAFTTTRDGLAIIRAWSALTPAQRRVVADMANAMSGESVR